MTEAKIKKLCPTAENITITNDGIVSMKLGMFAQSVGINYNKDKSDWQTKVINLYQDLKGMNRQVEYQQKNVRDQAAKNR